MSFQKIKSDSCCVGKKHRSATKNITGEITFKTKLVKRLNY